MNLCVLSIFLFLFVGNGQYWLNVITIIITIVDTLTIWIKHLPCQLTFSNIILHFHSTLSCNSLIVCFIQDVIFL
jgi:hypothetical protein